VLVLCRQKQALKLIKCFCGCSDMTEQEVNRIYALTNSTHHTLLDPEATRLLRAYLKSERSGDKDMAEQYLDIYEKCAELLQEKQRAFTQDEVDELVDLGLPYDLERDLTRRLLAGKQSDIHAGLIRVQSKCCNEIEASSEYRGFRDAIVDKLKRVPK
ncbi:hypothetical protein KR018_001847, partial [Drosophila ironensis]